MREQGNLWKEGETRTQHKPSVKEPAQYESTYAKVKVKGGMGTIV
jgi:hypothetical protein